MLGGGADRRFGDLVEDHPLYRYARFEGFQQMPGNSFALTVPIRGQIQLVHVFEQAPELADGAPFLRADDVERFEVGVDVDPESRPRLRLVLCGYIRRGPRQVTDVPPGGLDDVARAQVGGQLARLGGRLDDDQSPAAAIAAAATALRFRVSQLRPRSISYPGPYRDRPGR